jgi:hypothetical protein
MSNTGNSANLVLWYCIDLKIFNTNTDYLEKRCEAFDGKILITGGSQKMLNIKQGEYHQNLVITGLEITNGK